MEGINFDDDADLSHLFDDAHPQAVNQRPPRSPSPPVASTSKKTFVIDCDSETEDDDVEAPPVSAPASTSRHFAPPTMAKAQPTPGVSKPLTGQNDPRLSQHPWSRDVFKLLNHAFKLPGFRKNQLEAINGTLGGKDVFVLMPTGGGKSLCYQLPAVCQSGTTKGVTVVISPLLSLIQDQVGALLAKGIGAAPFNGDMTKKERDDVLSDLKSRSGGIALIYVTPELVRLRTLIMLADEP